MTLHALIACPHLQRKLAAYLPRFAELDIEVEAPEVDQQLSEEYLLANLHRFDGVVAGDERYTPAVLAQADRLKVIAKWGIGTDGIDVATARERGIAVVNTPSQLSGEVADVAIGYMIMLARQLHIIDAAVRRGEWAQICGVSLADKTLGIVGLGAIGSAVARRAIAHDMHVIGYDPYASGRSDLADMGVALGSLPETLATSDFISLNCALTPETAGLMGREQFALIRRGSRLVNTSRGGLIDEAALVEALRDGIIAGAALDVYEVEPLPVTSPLRQFPQCIFGSHNSSNTAEAVDRINDMAVANLLNGMLGSQP